MGAGPEHVAAFAAAARAYARRAAAIWELPHHWYRDTLVTVGGMVGAACAEWHLHAWDLARTLGKDYQPAAPHVLVAGWRAGLPQLPLEAPALAACGVSATGRGGGAAGQAPDRGAGSGATGCWPMLLRASERVL